MTVRAESNRRQVLFLLGLLWLLTAVGIATATTEPNKLIPHERLPVEVRCAVWAVPALVAWAGVWVRRIDGIAWTALCIPPLERCSSFTWAYVDSLTNWWWWSHSAGIASASRSALVYAAIVYLIIKCAAGLDRLPVRADDGEQLRE